MRLKFKSKIKSKAVELLKNTHIELKQISKDTGLSESWLSALKLGHLKHSDAGRVETLYEYLSKSEIKV